jgi:transcriptional regulator with XRE-family HTH domain
VTPPERDKCRRPITADEVPYLLDLGRTLRYWRTAADMTQAALADALAMSAVHVWRIEHGRRRTRRSTLTHIALALADASRRAGRTLDAVDVLSAFLEAGGPAIAPESPKSERSVERKQKRRVRENLKHDLVAIVERVDGPAAALLTGGPEMYLRRRVDAAYLRLVRVAG